MNRPKHPVKGTHVIMTREWVDERLGEGTFRRLLLERGTDWTVMLPSTWYDIHPLKDALEVASGQLKKNLEDVVTQISVANARRDLTTVYRAFLRVAGPHMVMNATSALWKNYVGFAVASKLENEKGHYLGECRQIPNELLEWSCGAWRGFVPTAIEMAGGKNCKSRIVERGPDGDAKECSYLQCEVTYDT